ncbi:serine-rich coiled-coil domain-containing protein 2 isoform X1 [Salmo salar]|uniref:Serine-rich coiled-coil domain-containing protein 2-like isoform X1 n=1 Tax=Salmo salar TaxID=8030 RepID=A0A1S3NEG1_SALSA|nr:serine-rich coiled-coil domain-containing protein 2-like isoform X1 [Salmo salar]XP_045558384.1 serine-rich coiled-coil domain-containing protein 2-like isoform X1 [Salmo salar]|eukprot:XP_014013797.1 PREDICTED: serine-rich coiled-coil domain-containing protein 2-like isoform X1 [Salmo salar]
MEDPVPNLPTMVSRLPKFGSRPTAVAATAPLSNGTRHHPSSSTTGKGLPTATTRQNGTIRMPSSFSLKWKKGKGGAPVERGGDSWEEDRTGAGHHPRQPQHLPMVVREIKKPSSMPATVKVQGCASTFPRTIRSRTGSRGAIPKQALSGQSLGNGKAGLNGQAGGVGRSGTGSLRRGQSRGSPHSNLTSSLSQSSDSLETATEENMVRSQSLTHVKRIPSPTEPPIIRSYSFNRASELTKELPRPLAKVKTSPLARPTPVLSSGGRGKGLHLSKGGPRPVPGKAGVGTTSCILPPITLRKSLLPSSASSTTKPSALSYRLTRPSLIKQPHPVLAATSQKVHGNRKESEGRRNSVEMPRVTPDLTSITDSPVSTPEGLLEEPVASSGVHPLGEGLEDMSLSSTSSLERNDTSEEYMDDFDNLGNGGDCILLLPAQNGRLDQSQPDLDDDNTDVNRRHGGTSMTGLHSFLSDSVDWARMGLTGGLSRRTSQALSGGAEYPLGSSLDLSPSDSGSGGTYMWDEEGLEALGTITHPCGSYDSDLNSMDILNNLDNLESGCDLDDDDLMLDDDLPEHGSLHSDTDGMSHLSHWRRQLCWTAEDHLHNDNRSDVGFQLYDGYQGTGLAGLHQAVELDELTLKHMAEDCCSVKTQLEHLKLLLQVEGGSEMDNTLDTLSPESREDPIQARQVEELLKEVQELREELRSKDRIIAQLTKRVAVPVEPTRCHCQQHWDVERVTVTYHDKATQTPQWRGHAPQILQPSRPWPNSVQQLQPQERLTSSAHTEAPRGSSNPGCGDPAKMIPAPSLPQSPGSLKIASIPKRPQEGPTTTTNSTQTSMAGFPRVVRGIQCRSSLRPGCTAPQSRLLPPPFRGLPCYSSANQASASSQGPALPACPRTKAPRQTPGLREPEIGGLKARGLVHPSLLRLPKPKSH